MKKLDIVDIFEIISIIGLFLVILSLIFSGMIILLEILVGRFDLVLPVFLSDICLCVMFIGGILVGIGIICLMLLWIYYTIKKDPEARKK